MSDRNRKTPLEEFVRSTIAGAVAGLPAGFRLSSAVKFKLRVVSTKQGGGGAKLYVVDLGAQFEAQEVQEVEFEVTNAEDPNAHIAEAQKKMLKRMGL